MLATSRRAPLETPWHGVNESLIPSGSGQLSTLFTPNVLGASVMRKRRRPSRPVAWPDNFVDLV